ncbi:MAG TPA: CARDB domain-containing protein [Pyrinomonadaceae bacterium]|nr:CARDB domain-containing protein [Pyrinomonadaceae bacterium]
MTIRFWTATTLLTIALINSQAQVTPTTNSWTYGASADSPTAGTVRFSIDAPNSQEFLKDPVSAIRQNGIELTSAQEAAWRQLAVALRRLANSPAPQGSRRGGVGTEALHYRITLKDAFVMPGRGWSRVAKRGGPERFDRDAFFSDPVGTLRSYGVDVLKADEPAWRQLVSATKVLRKPQRTFNSTRQPSDRSEVTAAQPAEATQRRRIVEGHSAEFYAGTGIENASRAKGGKAGTKPSNSQDPETETTETAAEQEAETEDTEASDKKAADAQPDLQISKFLFPPAADKKLRVQVVNSGPATSDACRLILTVRKINGIAAGRKTHVNVPSLAAGESVWLLLDAASILPVNVSLESTTFKLNVDATELVAESDESNNEVWHNL